MFFNGHRIDSTVHLEGLECIGTDPNVIFFPVAGFEIWGKKKKTTQNAGFLFAVFLLCCFVDGSYQFFFPFMHAAICFIYVDVPIFGACMLRSIFLIVFDPFITL